MPVLRGYLGQDLVHLLRIVDLVLTPPYRCIVVLFLLSSQISLLCLCCDPLTVGLTDEKDLVP